jgi:hypothetical protein
MFPAGLLFCNLQPAYFFRERMLRALSSCPGNRSGGTFSLPQAMKTICLAHSALSPLQYFVLTMSEVLGMPTILSEKKGQVSNSSQSAIFTSGQIL